jgi:hypothetical protein
LGTIVVIMKTVDYMSNKKSSVKKKKDILYKKNAAKDVSFGATNKGMVALVA